MSGSNTEKAGLFSETARCLAICDPEEKCLATARLWQLLQAGEVLFDEHHVAAASVVCGRPEEPKLVEPGQVPRRRLGSPQGRAALVHAIAHIEFNAINLALDAACRFRGMPENYYSDWLSVAADEARHFAMLRSRLCDLGHQYGDFTAHNGLWEMAEKTADSCLKRMALVPRVLEARGLDVTPGMIDRLAQVGDHETIAILEVILEEEVRHVEVGSRWFRYCCELEGLHPGTTFIDLLSEFFSGSIRGPFNIPARLRAGFSQQELDALCK
ncbi:MAG: uncharacterized ferritin-like protein (DUF455 family) [Bacteroidia bacterium]